MEQGIYGIDVRWELTWTIRPKYTSPRDIVVWLQLQHRTLWVAKHGGCADDKCTARGCSATENMTHLVDCGVKGVSWGDTKRVLDTDSKNHGSAWAAI